MPSLRRMASNIVAQIFAVIASMIDRIILVGILLRYWGTDLFSDYVVLQSAANLLLIVEFSVQIYFRNAQQAAFVAGESGRFRRLAGTHLSCVLVLTGVAMSGLIVFSATDGPSRLFHLARLGTTESTVIFALFGAGNLLTILRSTTTTIYAASGHFAYVVTINACILAVNTVASCVAALCGAGPVMLGIFYFATSGVGALALFAWDTQRRYPEWVSGPVWPTAQEIRQAWFHLKWYSPQGITQLLWQQLPVIALNAYHASGALLASFLIIRTMVNLIRQLFQFAAVGIGLEVATFAYRGDFARAWRHSAQVGQLTSVISGACLSGVLCFGGPVVFYWTWGAVAFSREVAILLLLPLALVAPLQQLLTLLQYTNRSRAPGLQSLLQLGLGAILYVTGEHYFGINGLLGGLASAEILSFWLLLPMFAGSNGFRELGLYCAGALAAVLGAAVVSLSVGASLIWLIPPARLPDLVVTLAIWFTIGVVPVMLLALPKTVRAALLEPVRHLYRPNSKPKRVDSGP